MSPTPEHRGPAGWLLIDPEAVPERIRDRVIPLAAVVLTPQELSALEIEPSLLDPADRQLAELLTAGHTIRVIATELGVASRSVERRLARMRERLGVDSTAALIAELARRGL